MKERGFVPSMPIRVVRDGVYLLIKDGQHRYEAAMELGLPVWYVVDDSDSPMTSHEENLTHTPWFVKDYVGSFARQGNKNYENLLMLADRTGMAITTAAALLIGKAAICGAELRDGCYKIKDINFFNRVNQVRLAIRHQGINWASDNRLIKAIAYVLLYGDVDDSKLCKKIKSHSALIKKHNDKCGYIEMLDAIYNRQTNPDEKLPIFHKVKTAIEKNTTNPK